MRHIQKITNRKIEERRVLQECEVPYLRQNELSCERDPSSDRVGLVSLHVDIMVSVYAPDRAFDRCQGLGTPGGLAEPHPAVHRFVSQQSRRDDLVRKCKHHSLQNGLLHGVAPTWQRTKGLTYVWVAAGSSCCQITPSRVRCPVRLNIGAQTSSIGADNRVV